MFQYHLQSFKIHPFSKAYLSFHIFWFSPYPLHWIKKCLCVHQLHIAVKILSGFLETIYTQYHAHNKTMLHSTMPSLIIIYHWWTPSWAALSFGSSLETACEFDNKAWPVTAARCSGAPRGWSGNSGREMGGLVFLPLQSHCYVTYLWLRYCHTSSHFNGTTRSHKSQAGYLVSRSSIKWPTSSITDKYIFFWTRT